MHISKNFTVPVGKGHHLHRRAACDVYEASREVCSFHPAASCCRVAVFRRVGSLNCAVKRPERAICCRLHVYPSGNYLILQAEASLHMDSLN